MPSAFNVKKPAIWHAIIPTYDASTVTNMGTLQQIALTKYHCQAHQPTAEVTPPVGMIGPLLGIIATPDVLTVITKKDTGSVVPNPTHITMDIGVAAIGATPGHSTDLPNIATHAIEAQVHTTTAVTCHTTDLHPIEIFPEMTADLNHTNPANNITNEPKDLFQAHKQHLGKIKTEDTNRLKLTIHPQNTTVQMIKIVTLRTI